MNPTVWVLMTMLYTEDGHRQFQPSAEFPNSTACLAVADTFSRQMLMQHRGWAMCVPKDAEGRLEQRPP
jgi:hypothetical protein